MHVCHFTPGGIWFTKSYQIKGSLSLWEKHSPSSLSTHLFENPFWCLKGCLLQNYPLLLQEGHSAKHSLQQATDNGGFTICSYNKHCNFKPERNKNVAFILLAQKKVSLQLSLCRIFFLKSPQGISKYPSVAWSVIHPIPCTGYWTWTFCSQICEKWQWWKKTLADIFIWISNC